MKLKSLETIPISQLTARVGSTPFYLYDRSAIQSRINNLRQSLSPEIAIHYAIKANPMAALICYMANLVDGFDVASAEELKLALDAGMNPHSISFAGPGKTEKELRQALAAEVLIHAESLTEIERISKFSQSLKIPPCVSLRVNPDYSMKSSGMKMGGGPSAFGMDIEIIPEVIKVCTHLGITIQGLHFFSGSQILTAATLIEHFENTTQALLKFQSLFARPLKYLCLGGGFGIPYFPQEKDLDIESVGNCLKQQASKLKSVFPKAKIAIELGRYLVGEAGAFIAKVVDKKVSRGKVFVIIDGGMNNHLAASGNLGQVIKRNYPLINLSKKSSSNAKMELVNVVGPLCTPLDTLATDIELMNVEVGDLIAVLQSGAYGLTASPQDFLSHKKINEVLF